MNDKDMPEIIKLYEEGMSTYHIAERYGTYANKIRRALVKHGVQRRTKSQAQKEALVNGRSRHPTKGSKRSLEERLRISSAVKKYWEDIDPKEYERRCNVAKENWHSMSEEERQDLTRLAVEAVRKAATEGSMMEKALLKELTDSGYRVEFHKKNLIPNENVEIDLYIPSHKTIIEIDGPSHFLPIWGEDKLAKQIKADNQKNGLILSKGFIILRIKNLLNHVSLAAKTKMVDEVQKHLISIEDNFPKESERYIEVEL